MQRILIVSDDRFLASLVSYALGDLEADIRCAADLEGSVADCRCGLYDLVILLVVSPLLRRSGTIERMRPRGLRRPRVYVISWQQSEYVVLSLLEQGVDQYLTFPVNLQRLRGKVSDALNLSRA